MFKPLALASVVTLVALTAQAQDGVVPLAPGVAATMSASASNASSSISAAPAFTGTIATLDLPGASSSSSSSSPGPAKPVVIPPDKKMLRRLTDATKDYVRNQRGWMDGSYKVYFYGYDNDLTIMAIALTQGDNAYNFVSAEGQPFKVAIDPATMQVKRELY